MTSDYKEIQDKIAFQSENKITCEIVNPDHAGINPPAIYTSQDVEFPEHLNKLMFTITNSGEKPLTLVPWPVEIKTGIGQVQSLDRLSYLRLDLSDFVNDEFQGMIKPSYQAKGLSARFVRISKSLEQIGKYRELDPSDITEKSVWILKIIKSEQSFNKLEKFVFKKGDAISVMLESVVSTVRPSLRYLDTSWVNPVNISDRVLVQNTIVLKRPSYFVGRPFPLEIFWLNNHNIAYISNGENYDDFEFENELSFAISNKGLKPLRTDCREEVLESPYFELVFLGGSGTGDTTKNQYIKDIQLEIGDDSYGDEWTHHKMIQGPNVTWRIQPRLYVDGERNKSILGIEEKGTITFTIKNLKVDGDPGVSMLYLKYYNIPDFDDNQIVLYIEKKELKGSIPSAGFTPEDLKINSETEEPITPPLRWELKKVSGKNETTVILGDKVGIGTENPEKELHVEGDTIIEGDLITNGLIESKGNIKATTGEIEAKNLVVTENIESKGSVKAAGDIEANKLTGTSRIESKGSIEAKANIIAKGNIESSGFIKAKNFIEAKEIKVDGKVTAQNLEISGNIRASSFSGIRLNWGPVKNTSILNEYDKKLDYKLPEGHVMVGLYSVHNNRREDRRWVIYYRKLSLTGV